MANKTLGELRAEVQVRLGFGNNVGANAANKELINSFLQDAQDQIYQAFDWADSVKTHEFETVYGESEYDWPADMAQDRLVDIAIDDRAENYGNRLRNSGPGASAAHAQLVHNTVAAPGAVMDVLAGDGTNQVPPGAHVYRLITLAPDGAFINLLNASTSSGTDTPYFPVVPGGKYEFSAWVRSAGPVGQLFINWHAADLSLISQAVASDPSPAAAVGNISTFAEAYNRVVLTAEAPASAVYAVLYLGKPVASIGAVAFAEMYFSAASSVPATWAGDGGVAMLPGWIPLQEGIEWVDRQYHPHGHPRRFQKTGDKLEIWPPPNSVYRVRFDYVVSLGAFSADTDRATMNDRLIFLHALANAKAHYRQPDAQGYATQFESMLDRLKSRARRKGVITRTRPVDSLEAMLSDPRHIRMV